MSKETDKIPRGRLKLVNIEDIIFGERFRKDYGDLEEFKESISDKGLLQPITIDQHHNLLAGGRRYTACRQLGIKQIPCLIRESEGEVDAREVELIENTFRKDFTWQEEAALIADIDRMYKAKDSNWSGRKTAILLEKSVGTVSQMIKLNTAAKYLPEIEQSKNLSDALRLMKKFEENAYSEELAGRLKDRIKAAPEGSPDAPTAQVSRDAASFDSIASAIAAVCRQASNSYRIGDVFKAMEGMPDNGKVHIIECDPPYGINLNSQKGSKDSVVSNVHSYEEVPAENYEYFLQRLCNELYRVGGKDCWLVFWFGPTWQSKVLENLEAAGWLVDEIPAIWAKTQGQTLQPNMYFARGYEPFYLCRKGQPVMAKQGRLNVFSYPGVPGARKYHPTERPVELIEDILSTLGVTTNNVFVPFLGSGATIRAGFNLGMRTFGNDLNDEYKDKFLLKIEEDTKKLMAVEKEEPGTPET